MRSDNIKFNDIFWNTLGTITYAAVSLLISFVVIKIEGKIEGGIFSFGYSTLAHLVYIVSFFGIRPMHIVDVKYRYSFKDYISFGRYLSFLSLLFGAIYISILYFLGNYSMTKAILLLILVCHGSVDGLADYYECEYQRVNKLYLCGQSLFFRIALYTLTLVLTLIVTHNLMLAEALALAVELVVFYFLNIQRSKNIFKTSVNTDKTIKNKNIFFEALPLFLITFLDMYIFTATKFAVDVNIGDAYNGFFNIIFMPANAIYLLMNLFMKPVLTPLSNAYYNDKNEYKKIIKNSMLVALAISLFAIIISYFFGYFYIDIVSYITGNIYTEFMPIAKRLLMIVIVGGCFYTVNTPLYYSLIIENKQKYLVIGYIITCILSFFVAHLFVTNLGTMGAAYGFAINMFLLCLSVFIIKVLNI